MIKKLNLLAAAVAALAATGAAHAALDSIGAGNKGNSSVLFVAWDANDNVSFAANLGVHMSDFMSGTALTTAGATASWNFGANTSSLASVTGNSWNEAWSQFTSLAQGNDFRWGVLAGDSITGNVSASNTLQGRGFLATGNPTQAQMLAASTSAPTGTALTVLNNFYAALQTVGTFASANNGAGTAQSGNAYLGDKVQDNLNGWLTWEYLVANGATSHFQYQRQVVADPVVFQIGATFGTDALSPLPATFHFDAATGTLSYTVAAIPEPGTYALMLGGLAAVGFVARRRRKA